MKRWHSMFVPAAVRRRPAAPRQCSSLCKSDSTPVVAGTWGGRNARRTFWWWAWQTSYLWTLPYPGHHSVTVETVRGKKGRELGANVTGEVHRRATWCQCCSKWTRVKEELVQSKNIYVLRIFEINSKEVFFSFFDQVWCLSLHFHF